MDDGREGFKAALRQASLSLPLDFIADGKIHRYAGNPDKPKKKNTWYVFRPGKWPKGAFGDWALGLSVHWEPDSPIEPMSDKELAERRAKKEWDQQQAEDANERAADRARAWWARAHPANGHGYLAAKGIKGKGLRQDGDVLLVPVRNEENEICNVQQIRPDGSKLFLRGSTTKGGWNGIGKPTNPIVICEGWATAETIHDATGLGTIAAFSAGNLLRVAKAMAAHHAGKMIVIAADDDWRTEGNPGFSMARAAAHAVRGHCVAPAFPDDRKDHENDFNDLAVRSGLDAVKAYFLAFIEDAQDVPVSAPILLSQDHPKPSFVWEGLLLQDHVNLLYADGGTGKSLLALHAGVAIAAGMPLFGLITKRLPVVALLAEDDAGEVTSRITDIAQSLALDPNTLSSLQLWCRVGRDSTLAIVRDDGKWKETKFLVRLRDILKKIGPALLILDTVSDIVALDETKRPPVNAFCKQVLGGLCREYNATVLVLAHPSKAAMSDGSGYAGTTAWNNAVRSRLLLERPKDDEKGPRRTLRVAKSNYGIETNITLTLNGRVFSPPGGTGAMEREFYEEKAVIEAVAAMRKRGIRVVKHSGDGQKPADIATAIQDTHGLVMTRQRVIDILNKAEREGRIIYQHATPGKNGKPATYDIAYE
jgi:phage/plasmid primase-like uncharacterized protein